MHVPGEQVQFVVGISTPHGERGAQVPVEEPSQQIRHMQEKMESAMQTMQEDLIRTSEVIETARTQHPRQHPVQVIIVVSIASGLKR